MDKKENIQKREVLLEKTDKRIAYEAEGLRRMKIRKAKRLKKFTENREFRKRSTCRGCGEDPYCYCGSGEFPYDY